MDRPTFKDVAHHFIGCEVMTYSGIGILASIDIDGRWYVKLNDNKGGTVGNLNHKKGDTGTFKNGDPLPPESICKPLLREMEDMTEEEAKDIWDSCMEPKDYRHNNKTRVINSTHTISRLTPLMHALCSRGFNVFSLDSSEYVRKEKVI